MSRMMLPLFIACVFSMASISNAQCDDTASVCPERVAVAYEILLAEVKGDFVEELNQQVIVRRNSEGSRNIGYVAPLSNLVAPLSNLKTYLLTKTITGDERFSVLARPKMFVVPFDTKYGIVTGTEEEWYKVALAPKRVDNSSDVISTRVTFVRTVLQDGKEVAYPYGTTVSLPAGGTMLLAGTLGDKEVVLLITGREAVAVE